MNNKRHAKQALGGVVFLVGCLFLIPLLRVLIINPVGSFWMAGNLALNLWHISGLMLLTCLAVYFISTGLRMMNPRLIRPPRFGWGKILIGSWMLSTQVGSYYHLVPEGPLPILKPSNPTEAVSMRVTGIVISLICVYLIFRGIRAGFVRHELQPKSHLSPSA